MTIITVHLVAYGATIQEMVNKATEELETLDPDRASFYVLSTDVYPVTLIEDAAGKQTSVTYRADITAEFSSS